MCEVNDKMYQVSTLQALALGYFKKVVTVKELLEHGNTGLGTFTNIDGEMIVLDSKAYRAGGDGTVIEADGETGVPFASVGYLHNEQKIPLDETEDVQHLKKLLNNRIEEWFGLNSIHVARIDGEFDLIDARSEDMHVSDHVELKTALSKNQKSFIFENVKGSLVCVYYPDFMDGINASGWHFHFISEDRKYGGHVFDLKIKKAELSYSKMSMLEIQLPKDPSFDTYALKEASQKDIKEVEQK